MKNKLLIFAFAFVLLLSFASATTLTFKQYESVNYHFVCLDTNNAYCTSTTTCQITINNPSGQNVVTNESLTYNETFFNYTLPTTDIGVYNSIIVCSGTSNAKSEVPYEVTPSGFVKTLGFYILILILSLGIIIIGYSVEDAWIIILGGMGLMLVGLFILFYGMDGMKDTVYTWGIGIITLMLGAYFGIRASLEQIGYE